MSKNKKYGLDRQNEVIARFRKDARSSSEGSAVMQCIARSKQKTKKVQKEVVRYSFRGLNSESSFRKFLK